MQRHQQFYFSDDQGNDLTLSMGCKILLRVLKPYQASCIALRKVILLVMSGQKSLPRTYTGLLHEPSWHMLILSIRTVVR
jgi:hypothetical protein